MKEFKLENGQWLLDMNGWWLVLSPFKMECDTLLTCGGWKLRQTAKKRDMVEILPGEGYVCCFSSQSGDRTWGGFEEYMNQLLNHPQQEKIFSMVAPNSRGGGCWLELNVYPVEFKPGLYNRPELEGFKVDLIDYL
jgi:hypothetical protein